jgi:hypothetical protein
MKGMLCAAKKAKTPDHDEFHYLIGTGGVEFVHEPLVHRGLRGIIIIIIIIIIITIIIPTFKHAKSI